MVERLPGNVTTEFGAPAIVATLEAKPLTAAQAARIGSLVDACWRYLDQVRARAPASLRRGPRGGGRDRDAMFDHVLGAEQMYAKSIGASLKQPAGSDTKAVREFRHAILQAMADLKRTERWPAAYAARRTAWHALDHAWEMQDRTE